MSSSPIINCDEFDQHADDLALGRVDEPLRSQLLVHASTCPQCQSLLEGLGTVVDRLLLVAPHREPPAGFESRALARIATTPVSARARWQVPLWAAAAITLIVGAAGFAAAHLLEQRSPAVVAPNAVILTAANVDLGSVQLLADPEPHVLLAIRAPRPEPGIRNCELQRPDGTWVHVGSWQVADIASGVWATGIDPALLNATAMRITTQDGTILATATFR